ncbi:MAG: hypothetical protein K2M73_04600 [Lachnospiraceae bacterium]|nr:hypothetical protein [Lachnospiraceae bacterium]
MAFVYEVVKEEDRELFNSFVPSRKANRNTMWVVDRERNIYSFWIGGNVREYIDVYFLAWNDLNIYTYTETKMYRETIGGQKVHIWIKRILLPDILKNDSEKIQKIVDMIRDILQKQFESQIVFEEIAIPTFREEE